MGKGADADGAGAAVDQDETTAPDRGQGGAGTPDSLEGLAALVCADPTEPSWARGGLQLETRRKMEHLQLDTGEAVELNGMKTVDPKSVETQATAGAGDGSGHAVKNDAQRRSSWTSLSAPFRSTSTDTKRRSPDLRINTAACGTVPSRHSDTSDASPILKLSHHHSPTVMR